MRTKTEATAAVKLLANPVAYRIISTLGRRGSLTTDEIAGALGDVATSSLYRHLARLRDAGLIAVVDERQARGAVERTYALASKQAAHLQAHEIERAPIGELRQAVRNFIGTLTADVLGYVESRSYARNRTQLRSALAVAELSDEEYEKITREMLALISAAKTRSTGSATKRRSFYLIALPEASSR